MFFIYFLQFIQPSKINDRNTYLNTINIKMGNKYSESIEFNFKDSVIIKQIKLEILSQNKIDKNVIISLHNISNIKSYTYSFELLKYCSFLDNIPGNRKYILDLFKKISKSSFVLNYNGIYYLDLIITFIITYDIKPTNEMNFESIITKIESLTYNYQVESLTPNTMFILNSTKSQLNIQKLQLMKYKEMETQFEQLTNQIEEKINKKEQEFIKLNQETEYKNHIFASKIHQLKYDKQQIYKELKLEKGKNLQLSNKIETLIDLLNQKYYDWPKDGKPLLVIRPNEITDTLVIENYLKQQYCKQRYRFSRKPFKKLIYKPTIMRNMLNITYTDNNQLYIIKWILIGIVFLLIFINIVLIHILFDNNMNAECETVKHILKISE